MKLRHSKAYEELALAAGHRAGINPATAEGVALDEAARSVRDGLWIEYERHLRDTQTYILDAIVKWLAEQGVTVGRIAVHRDRTALMTAESACRIAAERARTVIDSIKSSGALDLLAAGEALSAQVIFQALVELGPAALEDLSPPQIIKMIEAFSRLRRGAAEASLIDARRQETIARAKRFDDECRKAAGGESDGSITPERLTRIRKEVFGDLG